MDKIQSIWNELNSEQISSTEMTSSSRTSIIQNFQHESNLRERYKPLTVVFLILISVFFYFIVQEQEGTISISKFSGILLIVLSGIFMIYFSQREKVDFENIGLHNSVTEFIRLCGDYIRKAKNSLVIGIALQLVCLTIGLYLLIFLDNPNSHIGYKYTFFGFMGGLAGLGIGGSIASFNKHYKGLIDIISKFSNGD